MDEADDFKDDSSFEILHSSDEEDDSSISSYFWSSTLQGNFCDTMTDSYSSQLLTEEVEEAFKSEFDATTRGMISTNSNLPLELNLQTEDRVTDVNTPQNQEIMGAFSGDNVSYGSNRDSSSFPDKPSFKITLPAPQMIISPTSETTGAAECPYQPIEIENLEFCKIENSDNPQVTFDDSLRKNPGREGGTQRSHFDSSANSQELEGDEAILALMRRKENEVVQMNPSRKNCMMKLCPIMQRGLKIYKWISNQQCLQNLVTETKSSIRSFFNLLEGNMNSVLGTVDPIILLIIADASDSKAIAEAFSNTLEGHVVISRCQIEDRSAIPVVPIGHKAAFQALQFKIDKARQLHDPDKKITMICTVRFIAEVFSQRWQMGTLLCLEDPHLQLNLHNFTSTVPLPNEYIYHAEKLTPEYYPLREKGLALTFEEAIKYAIQTETKDIQEFLSGINHFTSLKSAAEVLAGMYKKYCKRFT